MLYMASSLIYQMLLPDFDTLLFIYNVYHARKMETLPSLLRWSKIFNAEKLQKVSAYVRK